MRRARRRSRPRRRGRLVLGVLGTVACLVLVGWFVLLPDPSEYRDTDPGLTSLMEQRIREARQAGDSLQVRHAWVDLADVSPRLLRAVIIAEDYRFRLHEGVDWVSLAEEVSWSGGETFSWWSASDRLALGRALSYAWRHRDELRGRSTITQQLAKNLYFGTDRSLFRKAMEVAVARRLERRLGKDRILELYLNVVEWGPGIFGAEAASRHYFGRSASDLTLSQAAALAATLPHPLTSNPALSPGRMQWRQALILERLDLSSGAPQQGPIPLPDPALVLPDTSLALPSPTLIIPSPSGLPPDSGGARTDTSGLRDDP